MTLQQSRFIRLVRARPQLFIVTAVAITVGIFLPEGLVSVPVTRWLIAWNIGTVLYVLLAAIRWSVLPRPMRQRVERQDDGKSRFSAWSWCRPSPAWRRLPANSCW